MQEVGRTQWITRRVLRVAHLALMIGVFCVVGALHARVDASRAPPEMLLVVTVAPVLVPLVLEYLSARYDWSACECSAHLQRPTASILGAEARDSGGQAMTAGR